MTALVAMACVLNYNPHVSSISKSLSEYLKLQLARLRLSLALVFHYFTYRFLLAIYKIENA